MAVDRSSVRAIELDPAFMWQRALAALTESFLAHGRETPGHIETVLRLAPEHPRGHAAKALMLVLLARAELKPVAIESAAKADLLALDPGMPAEARHFAAAAKAAAAGQWWRTIDALEAVLEADRSDSLAAKMCHAFRFMLGDKTGMLTSIEKVLARLPDRHPHRGYLVGCHAFALEENGHYARAELVGRRAAALQPRDAWGIHAVSHVHEMTGRAEAGVEWIEAHEDALRLCNNFGGHLFWHLALFRLEQGEIGKVLALYDREIRAERTDDFRDIANAASLLMRLELDGHAVGDRWDELADKAEARLADRSLVFADLHYLLALAGAGRGEAAHRLARSIATGRAGYASQDLVADKVGGQLAEGIVHFAEGRAESAYRHLRKVACRTPALGGSDAQRDIFQQIMLEAAIRAGDEEGAGSLLAERLAERGGRNRFASERLGRLQRQAQKRPGRLAVLAALAFPQVAPSGHL